MELDFAVGGVGGGSGRRGARLRSCPPAPAGGRRLLLYFAPQNAPSPRSGNVVSFSARTERAARSVGRPAQRGTGRSRVPGDMSGAGRPTLLALRILGAEFHASRNARKAAEQ